jgi:preprotein translocase subunit SecY
MAHIPVPNINHDALPQVQQLLYDNQVYQFFNIVAGGALQNYSIIALGLVPYGTAISITKLFQSIVPALEELSREGEPGRVKLRSFSMWLTIPIAAFFAYSQSRALANSYGIPLFRMPFDLSSHFLATSAIIMSMIAGSLFLVWVSELINERGIGSGEAMIVFGGIVAWIPRFIFDSIEFAQIGGAEAIIRLIIFLVIGLFGIVCIILFREGQRRIPVQYIKRVRGNKVYGGQTGHIPLKLNPEGFDGPVSSAKFYAILPATIASWFYVSDSPEIVLQRGFENPSKRSR